MYAVSCGLRRRQAFGLGASSRLIAKPFLCADPRCGASEASVRSGSFLALDCKAFFMRGSKALRFGIRLFSAGTLASAMALLLSASSGSQRPSRLSPSLQRGTAGAAPALLRKKQQAAKPGPYGYLPA
jgi:hypothetical protein